MGVDRWDLTGQDGRTMGERRYQAFSLRLLSRSRSLSEIETLKQTSNRDSSERKSTERVEKRIGSPTTPLSLERSHNFAVCGLRLAELRTGDGVAMYGAAKVVSKRRKMKTNQDARTEYGSSRWDCNNACCTKPVYSIHTGEGGALPGIGAIGCIIAQEEKVSDRLLAGDYRRVAASKPLAAGETIDPAYNFVPRCPSTNSIKREQTEGSREVGKSMPNLLKFFSGRINALTESDPSTYGTKKHHIRCRQAQHAAQNSSDPRRI
ncbi:uncharacterized protein MCYG_00296 [Microsporum canis CBS 113480]|uniref:Uncharacterized protein n=1 Tax=Arthroderma otae (strain ATCC MYA-4605 / CBS 113480) TaxID=554155 RepID=C5FCG4_ARTOC|nr:uncharacterized protein MCYG_00296 [Microsporum canis CBS 113480]EEQ27408.1 predicted protein [Microsporum canis CBS 113480]